METGAEQIPSGRAYQLAWRMLAPAEALLAFPLVLAVDGPGVDLAAWRRTVGAWLRRGREPRGIVGLRCGAVALVSVFFFAVSGRGPLGTSLCVPRAWAVEVGAPGRTARATLAAIEELAQRHGCAAIAIELPLAPGPAREIARALHRSHDGNGALSA